MSAYETPCKKPFKKYFPFQFNSIQFNSIQLKKLYYLSASDRKLYLVKKANIYTYTTHTSQYKKNVTRKVGLPCTIHKIIKAQHNIGLLVTLFSLI